MGGKADEAEAFLGALKDVVRLAEVLGLHCKTVEEFSGVCQLAIENDGQLHILMSLVSGATKR